MLDYNTSRDGLLQIQEEVLKSVIQKESILEVYDVDKTPLGRARLRALYFLFGTAVWQFFYGEPVNRARRAAGWFGVQFRKIRGLVDISDS
ncbi:hypothetical protein GWI33_001740 [Rhynchophorus ferrugineus]|uniref:Uncharacterized protein n=1 Tax=Rhynchophorus ferrugineus TaxID=354439 RepID=A0A834MPH8_RHYFE|nr:hypothetical protein GWI33_001740 [Rhynchophorus ferrugineus]